MELRLDFKPAAEIAHNVSKGIENTVLSAAKQVSGLASKANEYLFGDSGEVFFTLSGVGALAASQYDPSLLTVATTSTLFGSVALASKDNILVDDAVEPGEEAALQNQEAARQESLHNLALMNTVATCASEAIFGNNALGMLTLAATTFVRVML